MTRTQPRTAGQPSKKLAAHRNHVALVGQLTRGLQTRQVPGGQEVTTFVLTVRTDGRPGDLIDCTVRPPAIRARLAGRLAGDTLEITGALRHRFWRSGPALVSRYEVDVETVALRRRAVATDRRTDE